MKSLFLAAALLAGGAAFAQSPAATDPAMAPGGDVVAPSNANPERDARGIPVISDPAVAPAGWNRPLGVGGPADASDRPEPRPAAETYPRCSRTVTDNCVQAYERGRSPN